LPALSERLRFGMNSVKRKPAVQHALLTVSVQNYLTMGLPTFYLTTERKRKEKRQEKRIESPRTHSTYKWTGPRLETTIKGLHLCTDLFVGTLARVPWTFTYRSVPKGKAISLLISRGCNFIKGRRILYKTIKWNWSVIVMKCKSDREVIFYVDRTAI